MSAGSSIEREAEEKDFLFAGLSILESVGVKLTISS